MEIEIRVVGADALVAKLGRLEARNLLEAPTREVAERLRIEMRAYPPAPAGSRYQRTGRLAAGWQVQQVQRAEGVEGTVYNRVPYSPWVQGSGTQAAMHRGRWQTSAQVAQRLQGWIEARYQARIRQALEGR